MALAKGYGQAHAYNAPLGTETFVFGEDGSVPNSPLPLIVRRGAIPPAASDPAKAFETTFAKNGWTGSWRDGVDDYHHYHSTAHEVLGVYAGSARVQFGGEGGEVIGLSAGDVVVIPAGVGHALIADNGGFAVVGAYAGGRDWDMIRADPGTLAPEVLAAAKKRIAALPLPDADPVDGADGPLTKLWG